MTSKWICASALVLVFACSPRDSRAPEGDAQRRQDLAQSMHDSLAADIASLVASATALQSAAPATAGRGWDATLDAAAIQQMKSAWRDCRTAYEHVEGALAPIFPDIDTAIDARYDDFLASLGAAGDADLFDDKGVTGMHAIERILYADVTPASVVAFEKTLPGYVPAAFPSTEAQATAFKTKLAQRLIDDATTLSHEWSPAAIDVGVAFQGLVSLMNEQREKVNKARSGEEESRYAQMTLFDLRNNLDGTAKVYALFRPWVQEKKSADPNSDGKTADLAIAAGFQSLAGVYANYPGDAIPAPPASWSSDAPTAADLQTPFGVLWSSVQDAVNPAKTGSVVSEMNDVARLLGFPQFVEGA
jgi:iron uptake system component EfeO